MDEDKVLKTIVDQGERLDKIETKLVKLDLLDDVMTTQDQMMRILLRLDQERVFTNEKIKSLEADVNKIKLQLQIA